jgi:hypothetical protein
MEDVVDNEVDGRRLAAKHFQRGILMSVESAARFGAGQANGVGNQAMKPLLE